MRRSDSVFGLFMRALGMTVLAALLCAGLLGVAGPAAAQQSAPPALQSDPIEGTVPGETLGSDSQSDIWRAIRQGESGTTVMTDPRAGQLIQSEGDNWRAIRNGPLSVYGAWGLLGVIGLLALFFLLRGRVRIEHGYDGRTITRFNTLERMSHWLLAVSFIVLGLTGLNILYGRYVLLPVIGPEAFGFITYWGKILHNYVAFAFMVGLVAVTVLWLIHNIPNRHDLVWVAKGGGMFSRGVHPPARKFNAGQKVIFWLVVLGGISISLSGIALMFPFETAMFAKTFQFLNVFGLNLPETLTPMQEQQYAQLWHAIMSLFLVAVIIAHIYIGTIGMEGAFDAMGSGEVDLNWAREHHSLWVEEELEKGHTPKARPVAEPAE